MDTQDRLVKAAPKKQFSEFISSGKMKERVFSVIGQNAAQKFLTDAVSLFANNVGLMACDYASIFSAALQCASLKLSMNQSLGEAWIIPYGGRDGTKAQLQIGANGYIQMAIRTGEYLSINVCSIKEGEFKGWNPVTQQVKLEICEDPDIREELPTVGYYAHLHLKCGLKFSDYWSKAKAEKHAKKYSKSYASGRSFGGVGWHSEFDKMAEKTVLKLLIKKKGYKDHALASSLTYDSASIREDGTPEYIDNLPTTEADEDAVDVSENEISEEKK